MFIYLFVFQALHINIDIFYINPWTDTKKAKAKEVEAGLPLVVKEDDGKGGKVVRALIYLYIVYSYIYIYSIFVYLDTKKAKAKEVEAGLPVVVKEDDGKGGKVVRAFSINSINDYEEHIDDASSVDVSVSRGCVCLCAYTMLLHIF